MGLLVLGLVLFLGAQRLKARLPDPMVIAVKVWAFGHLLRNAGGKNLLWRCPSARKNFQKLRAL